MEIISIHQKRIISEMLKYTEIKGYFFLSGGTTLSYLYLKLCVSEDLDTFTEENSHIPNIIKPVINILKELNYKYEIKRQFQTFKQIFTMHLLAGVAE